MKEHILLAMKEQCDRWDELLKSLGEEQITISRFDDNWSIQDVLAHLWGWQQISIARVEAAVANREPEFPKWTSALAEGWEENANQTNAWIYEIQHTITWSEMYQKWRAGFLELLDTAKSLAEKDLLDGNRYSWLQGYSLAAILLASYAHHQEHLEKLMVALEQQ